MHHLYQCTRSTGIWLKLKTRSGASAVEYGLLAALIAIVILTAVTTLGTNLNGVFQSISNAVHSLRAAALR